MSNSDLFDEIMTGLNEAAAYAKGDEKSARGNYITVSDTDQSILGKSKWNNDELKKEQEQ